MKIVTGSGTGSTESESKTYYVGGHVSSSTREGRDHAIMALQKPDTIIRNPLVNGYRRPSGWSVTAGGNVNGSSAKLIAKATILHGNLATERDPRYNDPYRSEQKDTGTAHAIVRVPENDLDVNELRMKVLNNLRGEIWDVAMTFAELQSTANTVSGNLLRLARSMNNIKKRHPNSFSYLLTGRRRDNRRPTDKFLRETAGLFMEWKYGIMPTVLDIKGACKALDMSSDGSLFDNPPLLVARAKIWSAFKGNTQYRMPNPAWVRMEPIAIPFEGKHELHARCDYRVSGDVLRGINRFGIGLGTIGTVLFERTPFSFVLNMALPIAELIKAWTALAGVDVVGYSETRYSSAQVVPGEASTQYDYHRYDVVENSAHIAYEGLTKYFEFSRSAYSRPPMPVPFIRNPVSVGNLSTVLALFTQLRRKDVPK